MSTSLFFLLTKVFKHRSVQRPILEDEMIAAMLSIEAENSGHKGPARFSVPGIFFGRSKVEPYKQQY